MYQSERKPAVLVLSLAIMLVMNAPLVAFAQESTLSTEASVEPAAVTQTDPLPPQETVAVSPDAAPEVAPTNEQTTETVQETATSTQETAGADMLAGTSNPEEGATEAAPIPLEEATTTESVVIALPEQAPDLLPDQIPVEAVSDLTVVAKNIVEGRELTNAELNARIEPDFMTQLSGKTIPTKVKFGDAETVTTTVDPVSHDLHLSGSCDDVYYVVLLYKNQTDYELDPGSYIVNRAYPCVGGSYTYTLEDIPVSIQNGTYYLLIGAQGDKGSWRPVTELQEVTINRAN